MLCLLAAVILAMVPRGAGAADEPLRVADDAAAARALLDAAATPAGGFAIELGKEFAGTLLTAMPQRALEPGRYRLHAPLALSPLGDARTGGLQVILQVGEKQRRIHALRFEAPATFIDANLDFTIPPAPAAGQLPPDAPPAGLPTVSITWTLPNDKKAKFEREKTIVVPDGPEMALERKPDGPSVNDLETAIVAPKVARDGRVALADAPRLQAWVALRPPMIERLGPVAVASVRTDKIVYKPGETAAVTAVFRNTSARRANAEAVVELCTGLGKPVELHRQTLALEAGAADTWTGSFETKGTLWGGQVNARVAAEGLVGDAATDTFAVAENFFEVATVAGQPGMGNRYDDPAVARAQVTSWREQGVTAFEAFFWAPCDMFDFTPKTEKFFGGQHGYPATITGTRNLINAAHEQGLRATVYANLYGGSSAPALEMMRRHPEWFGQAEYRAAIVDDLDLLHKGKLGGGLFWNHNQVNLPPPEAVFKRHAEELIASHRQFGWDATRYDSYYPLGQEWMKGALALVRREVEAAVPGYRWGYNSIPSRDYRAGAIEGMLSGGGMTMEEGLSQGFESGPDVGGVADQLLLLRHIVWTFGGHNGTIYRKPRGAPFTPLDDIYASSAYLAAGAHPYYSQLESEMGRHTRFGLRYSEFLFNNRMGALPNVRERVELGEAERFLHWDRFARYIDLGGRHRRIVLHLLNAPASHRLGMSPEMKRPPILKDVPISLSLPAGAQLRGAWALCPVPEPAHEPLATEVRDGRVRLTVPQVRFWNVVVVDWDSDQPLEPQKPAAPAAGEKP